MCQCTCAHSHSSSCCARSTALGWKMWERRGPGRGARGPCRRRRQSPLPPDDLRPAPPPLSRTSLTPGGLEVKAGRARQPTSLCATIPFLLPSSGYRCGGGRMASPPPCPLRVYALMCPGCMYVGRAGVQRARASPRRGPSLAAPVGGTTVAPSSKRPAKSAAATLAARTCRERTTSYKARVT